MSAGSASPGHAGSSASSNGDVVQSLLSEVAGLAARVDLVSYYAEPLSSATNERLAELVAAYMDLNPRQRSAFLAGLPPGAAGLFGIAGHRLATLAAASESREMLLTGLVANAISSYDPSPRRDPETALAVFHHCARKLGVEPRELFEEAASYAGEGYVETLRAFGRREDVTLARFGWREMRTPDGVRFSFRWV